MQAIIVRCDTKNVTLKKEWYKKYLIIKYDTDNVASNSVWYNDVGMAIRNFRI